MKCLKQLSDSQLDHVKDAGLLQLCKVVQNVLVKDDISVNFANEQPCPWQSQLIRETYDIPIRLFSILELITIDQDGKPFAYITITAETTQKTSVDNNEIHLKRPPSENEENNVARVKKQTANFWMKDTKKFMNEVDFYNSGRCSKEGGTTEIARMINEGKFPVIISYVLLSARFYGNWLK